MRVGVIGHSLATATPTGVDRYLRELVTAIAARGDIQCVVASAREPADPTWLPDNVTAHHVGGPRRLVQLGWSFVGRPRVDRAVEYPDLVHVAVPAFPVPSRAPVVYTVHDLMPVVHPDWYRAQERFAFRRALHDVAERAAAIVAVSGATAADLVDRLGIDAARVQVVPSGIANRFLEPVPPAEVQRVAAATGFQQGQYLLVVGGVVTDRKNLRVLVHALKRLEHPVPLVFAGLEGRGAAELREEVTQLGLDKHVRFMGFVADVDLPALMTGACALVHPSRHEGFGFPPLEAMAVGTPAIVADATALPDTVGGAALLADPDDPDSWAAAITDVIDVTRRAGLVALGRVQAAKFTWANTAAATVEVYRRAVGLDGA